MFYVYILQSLKDNRWYTGSTNDLKGRTAKHNAGKIESTRNRRPFRLIYYEACLDERDARIREQYLKSAWGKRYIKNRRRTVCQNQSRQCLLKRYTVPIRS